MSSSSWLLRSFNRLLPFATPGTPLLQDLLHLAAVCLLLYFAPQIQEWIQQRQRQLKQQQQQQDRDLRDSGLEQRGHAAAINAEFEQQHQQQQEEDDFLPNAGAPAQQGNNALDNDNDDEDDDIAAEEAPQQAAGAATAGAATARPIGAKKAKSLARRDQRRAQNEFLRAQGDAQRARDAETAREREAEQKIERERRRVAIQAVEERRAREILIRREREEKERERRNLMKLEVVRFVSERLEKEGFCDLEDLEGWLEDSRDFRGGGEVDVNWVEGVIRASDILRGTGEDGNNKTMTFITGRKCVVRVTEKDMLRLYEETALAVDEKEEGDEENDDGTISREVLSRRLEKILRDRSGR